MAPEAGIRLCSMTLSHPIQKVIQLQLMCSAHSQMDAVEGLKKCFRLAVLKLLLVNYRTVLSTLNADAP